MAAEFERIDSVKFPPHYTQGKQDLEKAEVYLKWAIERMDGKRGKER